MAEIPQDAKYTAEHEYVKPAGGDPSVVVVGITDFAQGELGDVVYVELPSVGARVSAGDTFGGVESVKTASDLYAPVSGEVVAKAGATAVIQPGGSVRDDDVIAAADQHGMAMVFTGMRPFRH